ncbi:hypothetical protein EUGRSUZ_F01487 [Eucalyptus grandis]|uniref:Uncharacterized protein n=2 Tax=Eucalyptus grandis TaxID=71139 RepID=A0ACC3KEA8_EUCGR|nr:hypothetical protein EUGRSUZ_F01487 [Eucalyptus grandis]
MTPSLQMEFLRQDLNFTFMCMLAILILSIHVRYKSRSSRKLKTPPEVAGAWPVVGHLPILAKSHLPHKTLGSMADTYGPIFTVRLGLFPAVVVSSSEIAKECCTKHDHDHALASRPQLIATEVMGYNSASFGLAPYGPIESLLNPIVASATDIAIKELHKLWRERRMIQHAFRKFVQLRGTFTVADALPFLRWLDLGGHEKTVMRIAKESDTILSGWLEEHKKNSKSSSENRSDRDFIDVMLSTIKGMEVGDFDADTVIKGTLLAIMAGGTDTTSVTLTCAVSLLLNNFHVLKKTQEELDTQIGERQHVKESDIANLTYLHAIVKETLRLYPAGPLAAPHVSTEDCIINGYLVPKGTRLIFNIWKIQTNPKFLSSHKKADVMGPNFDFMPFGGGRRICPGISFGLQMVHSVLARLLHAFKISTPDNSPVDMSEINGLTVGKAMPLEVMLAPRLPNELYEFT